VRKHSIILIALFLGALVYGDRGRLQRDVRTKHFATAIVCKTCHANASDSGAMLDHLGRGIAPHDLWQSTMMANSARDPLFLAAVAAEVAAAPDRAAEIEAGCLHCHAPMASVEVRLAGGKGIALKDLESEFEEEEEDRAALARDGVSCTTCHRISEERLGSKSSFDGNFTVADGREIYGPHDKQFGLAMNRVSKYWPVEGKHILKSDHCATCHTQTIPGGHGFEATTFLEWRNSRFRDEQTCQSCHAPQTTRDGAPIRTRIARTSHGGDIWTLAPRSPVGRHLFVGGNTLVLAMLRDNLDLLHVKAPAEAFDATIAATRRLLTEKTARVHIEEVVNEGDRLRVVVSVENLSGHKFPTGHFSRRAWLRLRVKDIKGNLLFACGEHDDQGRLVGADGVLEIETAGGGLEPHHTEVRHANQVQIYEATLLNEKGAPVFTSARARGFRKDNRLLPKGWKKDHADAGRTQPIGTMDDEDFVGGSDTVVFSVPIPDRSFKPVVEVALIYQTVSARYAAELFLVKAPLVARFKRLYDAASKKPEVIARARFVGSEE